MGIGLGGRWEEDSAVPPGASVRLGCGVGIETGEEGEAVEADKSPRARRKTGVEPYFSAW